MSGVNAAIPRGSTADSHPTFRPEIQGLRAVAVLVVLVFHLWPDALPGGYVGVDVFFVISGFLITGILLRQAEQTGRADVVGFYIKRIKRLVPAATLVLFAVAVCVSLLPMTRWSDTAAEIAASALYVENWWLALQAVDYLAAENAPSPLQHYWSLSVEEQYYIAWPLMFSAMGLLATRKTSSLKARFGLLIGLVGAASLFYSIYLTPREPGVAYFSTFTRAWELALGGALAVCSRWNSWRPSLRSLLGWMGALCIFLAVATFSEATRFPGYAALLPTLGAALIIVGGSAGGATSVSNVLNARPMQYVGDLSYSLYLWHWPIIVFYQAVANRPLGLVDGVAVAAVSLALAHQTKVFVEDSFRLPIAKLPGRWKPFAFGAICMSIPLICWQVIEYQTRRLQAATAEVALDAATQHPGALALTHGVASRPAEPLPAPMVAKEDKGDPYKDGCIQNVRRNEIKECVYGDEHAEKLIIVLGDSHAVHWVPALQIIAANSHAKLIAITKSACALSDLSEFHELEQYQSCMAWSNGALQRVRELEPDLVIFAHSVNSLSRIRESKEDSASYLADSISRVWSRLEAQGISVSALADTPSFASQVPDCLLSSQSTSTCRISRARVESRIDPLVLATERHPSVRLIDLTDAICGKDYCEPVVGNVVAWRDAHHMTATFARTLAPALSREMVPYVEEVPASLILGGQTNGSTGAIGGKECSEDLSACLVRVRPSLAAVAWDLPIAYQKGGCHAGLRDDEARLCTLVGKAGGPTLFVIGDSHAAQWFPVYEHVAAAQGWNVDMTTKAACSVSDVRVNDGAMSNPHGSCATWIQSAMALIEARSPDYIMISQSVASRPGKDRSISLENLVDGYRRRILQLRHGGATEVIVLADGPRLGINPSDCLARRGSRFKDCSRAREEVIARRDPLVEAAEASGAPVVTANDLVCPGDSCPPIINDVLVWRDSHHVTATFARFIAPELSRRIVASVK